MDKIRALVLDEIIRVEDGLSIIINSKKCLLPDLSDFVMGKSKRVRSLICLLYLKANNATINQNVIDVLIALELIHNASLLHDDVIDRSQIRRGAQTLFNKYGSNIAILCGDYILSLAVSKLLELGNETVINVFLDATKKMSEAEILQLLNRDCEISIEQYLDIISGKTSSLFCAGLLSTALLSSLDTNIASNFGNLFGKIFQINNDMNVDSINNDKENGVKTIIDIIGIEKSFALKDNYKEDLSKYLVNIPDNLYKQGIEDLIKLL